MATKRRRSLNKIQTLIKNSYDKYKGTWWTQQENIKKLKELYDNLLNSYKLILRDLNMNSKIFNFFGISRDSFNKSVFQKMFTYTINGSHQFIDGLDIEGLQTDLVRLLDAVEKIRDITLQAQGALTSSEIKYDLFIEGEEVFDSNQQSLGRNLYNLQGSLHDLADLGIVKLLTSGDVALQITQKDLTKYIQELNGGQSTQLEGTKTVFSKMMTAQNSGQQMTNTELIRTMETFAHATGQDSMLQKGQWLQGGKYGYAAEWYRGIQTAGMNFKLNYNNQNFALGPDEAEMQQKYLAIGNKATITSMGNILQSSFSYLTGYNALWKSNALTSTTISKEYNRIIERQLTADRQFQMQMQAEVFSMDGLNAVINEAVSYLTQGLIF